MGSGHVARTKGEVQTPRSPPTARQRELSWQRPPFGDADVTHAVPTQYRDLARSVNTRRCDIGRRRAMYQLHAVVTWMEYTGCPPM